MQVNDSSTNRKQVVTKSMISVPLNNILIYCPSNLNIPLKISKYERIKLFVFLKVNLMVIEHV